ncbi:hypothetical protein BBW68_05805 [Candidatus Erwinia dacicola]|uniref:Malic enzyme, NAD binding domain protein n=1 Tax=Candidatus Erwinia dacicola TaxID=252393 RepID=A0A1E7Z3H4_9GAMM|nr:hypothetical protein BBW68_05805 [Candidatus Erwinia dacicola]
MTERCTYYLNSRKNISDVRLVVSGAGASAIACLNLLMTLGMQKHNIVVCDSKWVSRQSGKRSLLDVGATAINEEMKLAAVHGYCRTGAGGAERRGRLGLRQSGAVV